MEITYNMHTLCAALFYVTNEISQYHLVDLYVQLIFWRIASQAILQEPVK